MERSAIRQRFIKQIGVPVDERSVTVNGLETRYITAGQGKPLLLLHGSLECGALSWYPVLPALARTFRVIAPDCPGYGESAKPATTYDAAFYTTWLHGFLHTLNVPQLPLIGSSQGGAIALHYAIRHPFRVKQLVQHEQALRQQDQGEGTIAEIAAALDEARQRVATWPLDTNDFSALQPGLQRSYKRGRKRLAGAYTDCTPVAFHEWRKCVKDLGYQLRMLKPIWPELIDPLIDELHTLSDDLGDDHDLDQLCAVISAESNLFRYQNEREALAALITQRRLALEARARPLGVKLYAEAPAAFVERHAVYWQAWQGEAEDEVAAC